MRRPATLALVLLVVLAAGCGKEQPRSAAPPRPAAERALAGAPAPLASLHAQANQLLPGGARAFRARLAELRGHPVVVNKWASWCGPCRAEFPFFQRQALKRGKTVAFLGVDSLDDDDDARRFLREFPVPYPSYRDPEHEVAKVFNGTTAFPTTAFYDRSGRLVTVKQGGYAAERVLAADIDRYAR